MIRINLLRSFSNAAADSYVASSGSGDRDQIIKQGAKGILIIILGPLVLFIYEMQALPVLEKKVVSIQTELADTQAFNLSKSGLAAEIKKYEQEQTKINAQMNFINKMARDKINEFKLFQHLQNSTPESVWVNQLEFKNNILTINIESDVPEDLNKFSVRLSNTEFLTNIIPTDQSIKLDPFAIGVNTTTQNLRAQFNSEVVTP